MSTTTATRYGNPRMEAVITDWPHGAYRTTAIFRVETHPTRGQRGTRFTIDPKTGRPSALKTLTYSGKVRLVDGDDGRIYIAEKCGWAPMITVMRSDMRFQHEVLHCDDPRSGDRYANLLALFGEG